tara:strand:+ start:2172 stop:3092 length:921 start_codon:yes stop_codon:yes gene_type:complete
MSTNLNKDLEDDVEIVIEDDTPAADRGKEPMPKEIVDELEADELEEYSDKVKTRLKQMKKVWHDERREKERAAREKDEALSYAQRVLAENNYLKQTLSVGEQSLVNSYQQAAQLEATEARREYKEAYEAGDSDKVIAAQEKLNEVGRKLSQLRTYKPTVQAPAAGVQSAPNAAPIPRPDTKTMAWQERNTWWGVDPEMTASALGLHQKLERERGPQYVGSDEYWDSIDNTMRRRFPEYFDGGEETQTGSEQPATRTSTRPATVVAPASRSTSSKKIVLKQSQLSIAKKLGITPEQYAREQRKLQEN